jgi:serine/threonine protein phosphatase PrpC
VDIRGYASTHVGRRENNEDAYLADFETGLFLVADGMGGYEGGEIASHLVVDSFQQFFDRGGPADIEAFTGTAVDGKTPAEGMMELAVRRASRAVEQRRQGRLAAMGSTVVAMMMRGDWAVLAHVGDSRIYRLRNRRLECMTRDHSLYAQLLDAGVVSARAVANRNLITRAIGVPGSSKPDVATHRVHPGDVYLLCSDGLTDVVPDSDIESIITELPLSRAVDALVAEAYVAGSADNITALLVQAR